MLKHFFHWTLFLMCMLPCAMWAKDIRIMSYNIRHGEGMDGKIDLERIANVIRAEKLDFVAIQEVDSCTTRSSGVDQPAYIGKLTGMQPTFGWAIRFQGGKYGVMVLSRETPISVKRIPLPNSSEDRVLLVCEFKDCVIACTHLSLVESEVNASADIIIREAKRWNKPFFAMGDWNTVPESDFITHIKEVFTFLNDFEAPTFPSDKPHECIDYIAIYRPNGQKPLIKKVTSQVINEPMASDHRPVMVTGKLRSSKLSGGRKRARHIR